MADAKERLQSVASQFGDADISIHFGKSKVFPGREISEKVAERVEAALRSPEREKASLRVMQGQETIYRSSKGEVTVDVKGVKSQFRGKIASPEVASKESGGAITVVQSKALIPLQPTAEQLDELMPPLATEPTPQTQLPRPKVDAPSPEQALREAIARIDALQTQLESTKKTLEELSEQVKDSGLKAWATKTALKIGSTVDGVAQHASTWVKQATETLKQQATLIRDTAHKGVEQVKAFTHTVASAAHLKTVEIREGARQSINNVLSPVDSAAVTAVAKRVIEEWGKNGEFRGNTFNFRRSESGDISIHNKAGEAVFVNGAVTDKADAQTVAHLSQLPRRMEVAQNFNPTPAPTMRQEFAR
jgi:chaperonin cofactor prefoldin